MTEGKRGGMPENSFGGRNRIDQLDLMKYKTPDTTPEQMLYLSTIQDAVHNYLFYGLGQNGTSSNEFFKAYRYFFEVSSEDQLEEDKPYCFDIHYTYAGLSLLMNIEVFRAGLRTMRRAILRENKEQIKTYIAYLQRKFSKQRKAEFKVSDPVSDKKLFDILMRPNSSSFSKLLYITNPQSNIGVSNGIVETAGP